MDGDPSTTGGPLKPGFGLSGTVLALDKVLPPLVRVFVPSILTLSRPVPHSRLRSGENCSTPSPPDARTTQPSRDFDEYSAAFHKLRTISNVEIVVPLLPEMIRIANQTPRYSLLQRLQRIGQRILLRFAEQEVNMLRHDYIPVNVKPETASHPLQA